MEAKFKRHLGRRLAAHPFLYLLVVDRWFRAAFCGFLMLPVFLALFLPRIWTKSPPGFRPIIKVSGLDLAQAWSLKRSALKSMAAGRYEEANYSWMAALINNPADAGLLRGALKNYLSNVDPKKYGGAVARHSGWLLALTATNLTDLELVAQVLARFGRSDLVLDFLEPQKKALTPKLEAAYLKALLFEGRVGSFSNRWNLVSRKAAMDEELRLCHAAWDSGWSGARTQPDSLRMLRAALDDSGPGILAARLLLIVACRRLDLIECSQMLDRLTACQADTLLDHIGYWRLLALHGRKDEAVRFTEPLPKQPASAKEVIALTGLYQEWALPDHVQRVLKRFLAEFEGSAELWITYAETLLTSRDWDELRRLALQMRNQPTGQNDLAAYSHFLEGRAELGLSRHFHAAAAFQKMAEWDFHHPGLGLRAARDLIQLGYAELARQVLSKLEPPLGRVSEYWNAVFHAAEKLRQPDLMVSAGARAFELRPNDPVVANNYAAALLIQRQKPEAAVGLTLFVLTRFPHSLPAVVNHAAALLRNERVQEAEALLKRVKTGQLSESQRALYHLNRFEICVKRERYEEAWLRSGLIDLRHLYSPQVRWFEDTCKRIFPASATLLFPRSTD
ncbi:MAG: hypothetical protein HY735_38595 [Verrucomicrobia bacterium]|nr:hypothetical protein [Verrucomicrobiota bacterium]